VIISEKDRKLQSFKEAAELIKKEELWGRL
jgi:hypothetical protein